MCRRCVSLLQSTQSLTYFYPQPLGFGPPMPGLGFPPGLGGLGGFPSPRPPGFGFLPPGPNPGMQGPIRRRITDKAPMSLPSGTVSHFLVNRLSTLGQNWRAISKKSVTGGKDCANLNSYYRLCLLCLCFCWWGGEPGAALHTGKSNQQFSNNKNKNREIGVSNIQLFIISILLSITRFDHLNILKSDFFSLRLLPHTALQ